MLTKGRYNSISQSNHPKHHRHHHHHHHHRSNRSSSTMPSHQVTNQYLNNNGYHGTPFSTLSVIQCSAYFIYRVDLNSYAEYRLRQTVDSIISGPKSRGLKVKLSLPNEGLIIENIHDPNQSWMYKTSELLYFWRDPYYLNIIVIITINRSHLHSAEPYSASIFRLRGNESVQLFLQRAQNFFAQLSAQNITRDRSRRSIKKSASIEKYVSDDHDKNRKNRSRHRSISNERKPVTHSPRSTHITPVQLVTRAEFDPGKSKTNSITQPYSRRTYSETTLSSDTPANSNKQNDNIDNEDKQLTNLIKQLSHDNVAELVRELKELRQEIATLKLETRHTPVRSRSTSPLPIFTGDIKQGMNLSPQSEDDIERKTDFSLVNYRKQQLLKNNNTTVNASNETPVTNKIKNKQSNVMIKKPTFLSSSNNTEIDQEESTLVNSSQMNGLSNGFTSSNVQEVEYRPTSFSALQPAVTYQNNFTHLNNSTSNTMSNNNQLISNSNYIEDNPSSHIISTPNYQNVLNNVSYSIPIQNQSSSPKNIDGIVSFHSSVEDSNNLPEPIYENVPNVHNTNSNQDFYYKLPNVNETKQQEVSPYLRVTLAGNYDSELEQQYLSQLFATQNGMSSLIPHDLLQKKNSSIPNENSISTTQETPPVNQQYSGQPFFANHLTNPSFNTDKQLLANTIANQFGFDIKSPQLQQLIENQHLFAANKRTFANMVWQMSREEENALCSSPGLASNNIDTNITDSHNSTANSILKSKKISRSISKRQHITWDRTLE